MIASDAGPELLSSNPCRKRERSKQTQNECASQVDTWGLPRVWLTVNKTRGRPPSVRHLNDCDARIIGRVVGDDIRFEECEEPLR